MQAILKTFENLTVKYPKLILLSTLLILFFKPTAVNSQQSIANGVHELTDVKNVEFAWNLRDWLGRKVDSLSMDIYYPTGATSNKKYPTVVLVHAGDFLGGNKTNESSMCDELADYGYIIIAPNYRTGYNRDGAANCTTDTTTLTNAIYRSMQDCDACLRFIKANAGKYNIDTNWLFISGNSAGCTVALNTAYTNDSVANIYFHNQKVSLGSLDSSGNTLPHNYTLKGIGGMWGFLFSDKMINKHYRSYPTILFKGADDVAVPDSAGFLFDCPGSRIVYSGIAMHDRLLSQNTPSTYYILSQAGHGAYDEEFCMENIACFFKSIILKKAYTGIFYNYTPSCPQYNGDGF